MNLETIYYIGQTIAVIAILGSLIAIWVQQQQTNRIARADMTERMLGKFHTNIQVMVNDPHLALQYANLVRGEIPKDEAVSQRLIWFFTLVVQTHYSSYFLQRDHLSDERVAEPLDRTLALHLKLPLFAAEWDRTKKRRTFPDDYIAYVDGLLVASTSRASA
ncbi:MAG: hypothetical protein VR74_10335 [Hyphomonas sp. BRH_c22]|uniref:hypothetical protein n=1 Tax=Hyphomonas sp. BRH_c22 TaxID=1629710 RepID=UPI0005F20456|nr:hypothetical protein [Hyphomonas sp. BRH_c22]KJS37032.1 MAG: hypothetical protein VR74_10335 [Hyphomonas sp. BRH_c22]